MDGRKRGKKSLSSAAPRLQCRFQLTHGEEEEETRKKIELFILLLRRMDYFLRLRASSNDFTATS